MKKLIIILFTFQFIFIACEKENENPCPVVDAKVVPAIVKDAFLAKYPASTVEIWFNKDNSGYCAFFKENGEKTLVHFKNDGSFIKEEDQHGDHQNNDEEEGCECEIDD